MNLLRTYDKVTNEYKIINLGGKNTINVTSGDILTIMSPGGGGYGYVNESVNNSNINRSIDPTVLAGGSLHSYSINQITA